MKPPSKGWGYENTLVLVNWFIWTFAVMDRLLIAYLFPILVPEFNLSFAQVGLLIAVTSLMWGVFIIIGGTLGDKYGRKPLILFATLFFSLFSWASGLARNVWQMFAIRAVNGAAEGLYPSNAIATIAEESTPSRRGLNLGIWMTGYPAGGLFLAAIYGTFVASTLGWQWAFYLTVIWGVIMAALFWRFIREPASTLARKEARREGKADLVRAADGTTVGYGDVLRNRNVVVLMATAFIYFIWVYTIVSFGTLYLTQIGKMDLTTAGAVFSFFGIGSIIGSILLPWLSDSIGRRPAQMIGFLGAAVFTLAFAYLGGTSVALSALLLFLSGFFGFACASLVTSTGPAEAVPFTMAGLAVGLVVFSGELSSSVAIWLVGGLADIYGLPVTMLIAGVIPFAAIATTAMLKETAPRFLAAPTIAVPEAGI